MRREYRSALERFIPWAIIIGIIWGMAEFYPDYAEIARRLGDGYELYRAMYAIGFFVIGALFETERLLFGIRNGTQINIFGLIISVLLLSALLLPFTVGAELTGFGTVYNIMQLGIFRTILGMGSGIIFIRSITAKINYKAIQKSETEERVY